MNARNERFRRDWAEKRRHGRRVYILKFSLVWALAFTVVMIALARIFDGDFSSAAWAGEFEPRLLLGNLLLGLSASVWTAVTLWNDFERRYRELS